MKEKALLPGFVQFFRSGCFDVSWFVWFMQLIATDSSSEQMLKKLNLIRNHISVKAAAASTDLQHIVLVSLWENFQSICSVYDGEQFADSIACRRCNHWMIKLFFWRSNRFISPTVYVRCVNESKNLLHTTITVSPFLRDPSRKPTSLKVANEQRPRKNVLPKSRKVTLQLRIVFGRVSCPQVFVPVRKIMLSPPGSVTLCRDTDGGRRNPCGLGEAIRRGKQAAKMSPGRVSS